METSYKTLKGNPLFQGVAFDAYEHMLRCLGAKTAAYQKNEVILLCGAAVSHVGLIVSGRAQIVKEDAQGRSEILTGLCAGELFAEVFACAGIVQSPVTVLAMAQTEVLWLNYKKIVSTCATACPFHTRLIENMLKLLAQKNLLLNQKNEILAKQSIREKLLAFFDAQRGTAKSFSIPYNREELARYLCVNRSALSYELGRMQKEGLIAFSKNRFKIL